jgi:hypothetical protein
MHQHFDAEQLAAFAEGSLSREERTAAEAHAADCPRCLQLLAVMVRTEEATAIHASRQRRLPVVLRWSVPLLAGAGALALWINVRPQRAMVPAFSVPSHEAAPSPAVTAEPVPLADKKERIDDDAKVLEPRKRESVDRIQPKARADQTSARIEPEARATQARQREEQRTTVVAPVPPLPAAAPPAPVADTSAAKAFEAPARRAGQTLAEIAPDTQRAPITLEVLSPDRSTGWRSVDKTIVRSSDGGRTWSTEQVLVQSELLAGASPSARVAWFVGRAGYILLTTGTNQWRRVTFPESIDLAAVSALSEREAEVRASDGRAFATSDGGQTWRPR